MSAPARLAAMLLVTGPLVAGAQVRTSQPDPGALERQLQNPITDLMIFQVFSTVERGLGPTSESRTIVNAQALLPMRMSDRWNLLSWTQVLILSTPPPGPGAERVNGIGDTTQYLLAEPSRVWRILWGLGLVGLLPTATNTELGTGVFGLGPAGLVSYQDEVWTLSLLAHHVRSLDGAVGRPYVERTFLKPLLSYTFPTGAAVGIESETTFEWSRPEGERWIVPLQVSLSRVTLVGPVPLNLQLGLRWYPWSPAAGPAWGIRLAISFVVSIHREEEGDRDGEGPDGAAAPGG